MTQSHLFSDNFYSSQIFVIQCLRTVFDQKKLIASEWPIYLYSGPALIYLSTTLHTIQIIFSHMKAKDLNVPT